MAEWFAYSPVDTMFIRGAEPLVRGETHGASTVFPPPVSTIEGALRTAVLAGKNINPSDYNSGKADPDVTDYIGLSGSASPFSICGPLFLKDGKLLTPAPYIWYVQKDISIGKEPVPVFRAHRLQKSACIYGNVQLWVKGPGLEMNSVGGHWVDVDSLVSNDAEVRLFSPQELFQYEIRTGIAMEVKKRSAREGHLYSLSHVRLNPGVKMVFSIDKKLPLPEKGMLCIGGEQRFGGYERITLADVKEGASDFYMSLSQTESGEKVNECVVATGKPIYLGGWDMHAGFHKPMKGYYPAGSVFSKKINNNMIRL